MEDQEKFIEFMALTKRLSDKSIELYMNNYYRFGNRDLTQDNINAFLQECGNNDVVRGFMKAYLTFLGLHKKFDLSPRPTGKARLRIVRPISKNDIETLSSYLYRQSFQKGIMFDLMYQGALRKVEVPTIRINSFLWEEWEDNRSNFIKLIVLGKGNKERTVLIDPATASKLLLHFIEHHHIDDPERLKGFYKSSSLLFDRLTLPKIYKAIKYNSIKVLNGRDIRPHELRHQRATELEQKGVTVQDIKVYLGHSNVATTEKYLHKSEKESIEKISNILTT
jgi:integrase